MNQNSYLLKNHLLLKQRDLPHFRDYENALKLYWQQNFSDAIKLLTNSLLENPSHSMKFSLYRLWLEILAQENDEPALLLLDKHFILRSNEDDEKKDAWLGLRGVLHLELDNMQACDLFARTKVNSDNPFFLEFLSRYRLRQKNYDQLNCLLEYKNMINDFLIWQTIARLLLYEKDLDNLEKVLNITKNIFTDSPIFDEFMTHQCLENDLYEYALEHNRNLRHHYPKNIEYFIVAGYILIQSEKFKEASKVLLRANELSEQRDPDILNLLAYCNSLRSEGEIFTSSWEKSQHLSALAIKMYREQNVDNKELRLRYQMQLAHEKTRQHTDTIKLTPPKNWLLHLGPKARYEFLANKSEDIEYLIQPFLPQANQGNLVFVVGDDYHEKDMIRLLGIYEVLGQAFKTQNGTYSCCLKLIYKFSMPIKIQSSKKTWHKNESQLYNLDNAVFREFINVIKAQNEDTELKELSYLKNIS